MLSLQLLKRFNEVLDERGEKTALSILSVHEIRFYPALKTIRLKGESGHIGKVRVDTPTKRV